MRFTDLQRGEVLLVLQQLHKRCSKRCGIDSQHAKETRKGIAAMLVNGVKMKTPMRPDLRVERYQFLTKDAGY